MATETADIASIVASAKAATEHSIEKAIREAHALGYQEGRDAAIRKIMAAATDAAPAGPEPMTLRRRLRLPSLPEERAKRAPWGTSTKAANITLEHAGAGGIEILDVVKAADELGYPIAESSARSILSDMANRGEVARGTDGRWRRVQGADVVIAAHHGNGGVAVEADPAASDPQPNQGGSDGTALAHHH